MYGSNMYGSTCYGKKTFRASYTFLLTKALKYKIKINTIITKALKYSMTIYQYKYVPQGTVYTDKY